MEQLIELFEAIKGEKSQWYLTSHRNHISFAAEIKNITESAGGGVTIQFKGPNKTRIYLNGPFFYQIENDEKKVRYVIKSADENTRLICGYIKDSDLCA